MVIGVEHGERGRSNPINQNATRHPSNGRYQLIGLPPYLLDASRCCLTLARSRSLPLFSCFLLCCFFCVLSFSLSISLTLHNTADATARFASYSPRRRDMQSILVVVGNRSVSLKEWPGLGADQKRSSHAPATVGDSTNLEVIRNVKGFRALPRNSLRVSITGLWARCYWWSEHVRRHLNPLLSGGNAACVVQLHLKFDLEMTEFSAINFQFD